MKGADEERLRGVLAEVELPDGVHAEVLLPMNLHPEEFPPTVAVWGDYPHARCPGCDQPVQMVIRECPVVLSEREVVPTTTRRHGCGEWLEIGWEEPAGTGDGGQITPEDVMRTAEEIHADLLRLREEVVPE